MSLINRLLQDLDSRHAPEVRQISTGLVRPLPSDGGARSPRNLAIGAAVLLLAGIGAGIAWRADREPASPSRPATASDAGPVAPTAAAPIRPATSTPPTALPLSTPADAGTDLAAGTPRGMQDGTSITPSLKIATVIAGPVALRAEAPATPDAPALPPMRPPPAPRTLPRPVDTSPAVIEKQNRAMSAPDRAALDYRQALAFFNEGRPGAAVDSLRSALRADPSQLQARLMLASLLLEKRQLDEARSVLQEGLAADPSQPELAMALARVQVELGDSAGAAQALAGAAPAAAGNAEFRGFNAAVLQRLGRHKEAADEFQAALRLQPQAGLWWMGLGISLEADGRPDGARDAYRRARETGRLTPELDRFVGRKLQAAP